MFARDKVEARCGGDGGGSAEQRSMQRKMEQLMHRMRRREVLLQQLSAATKKELGKCSSPAVEEEDAEAGVGIGHEPAIAEPDSEDDEEEVQDEGDDAGGAVGAKEVLSFAGGHEQLAERGDEPAHTEASESRDSATSTSADGENTVEDSSIQLDLTDEDSAVMQNTIDDDDDDDDDGEGDHDFDHAYGTDGGAAKERGRAGHGPKRAKLSRTRHGIEGEDTQGYQGSRIFLKGKTGNTPQNDYSQHFVNSKQRPQNFLRHEAREQRYQRYPRLRDLANFKRRLLNARLTPPMGLRLDPGRLEPSSLRTRFGVIYIDAPLPEYARRAPGLDLSTVSWRELERLPVRDLAEEQSFLFMWIGCFEGLRKAPQLMRRWGFNRVEEICWLKTNKTQPGRKGIMGKRSLLQHTKEHCLVGIKGQIQRREHPHILHANMDVDVIVSEDPPIGSTEKPEEIFDIIERMCQTRKRLHLYASGDVRPGWVGVGVDVTENNYDSLAYLKHMEGEIPPVIGNFAVTDAGMPNSYVGTWERIEKLRPKSPKAGQRPMQKSRPEGRASEIGRRLSESRTPRSQQAHP